MECENSKRDSLRQREGGRGRNVREGEKKRGENKAGLITEAFSGQCIQNTPAELLLP